MVEIHKMDIIKLRNADMMIVIDTDVGKLRDVLSSIVAADKRGL